MKKAKISQIYKFKKTDKYKDLTLLPESLYNKYRDFTEAELLFKLFFDDNILSFNKELIRRY